VAHCAKLLLHDLAAGVVRVPPVGLDLVNRVLNRVEQLSQAEQAEMIFAVEDAVSGAESMWALTQWRSRWNPGDRIQVKVGGVWVDTTVLLVDRLTQAARVGALVGWLSVFAQEAYTRLPPTPAVAAPAVLCLADSRAELVKCQEEQGRAQRSFEAAIAEAVFQTQQREVSLNVAAHKSADLLAELEAAKLAELRADRQLKDRGSEIAVLQRELTEARDVVSREQASIKALECDLAGARAALEKERQRSEEAKILLTGSMHQELERLRATIDELQKDKAAYDQRLEARVAEVRQAVIAEQQQRHDVEQVLQETQEEVKRLQQQCAAARDEVARQRNEFAERAKRSAGAAFQQARKDIDTLKAKNANMQTEFAAHTTQMKQRFSRAVRHESTEFAFLNVYFCAWAKCREKPSTDTFDAVAQKIVHRSCPAEHSLQRAVVGPETTGFETHFCATCSVSVSAPQRISRCYICDYNLCDSCACSRLLPVPEHAAAHSNAPATSTPVSAGPPEGSGIRSSGFGDVPQLPGIVPDPAPISEVQVAPRTPQRDALRSPALLPASSANLDAAVARTLEVAARVIPGVRLTQRSLGKPTARVIYNIVREVAAATEVGGAWIRRFGDTCPSSKAEQEVFIDAILCFVARMTGTPRPEALTAGKVLCGLEADLTNEMLTVYMQISSECSAAEANAVVQDIVA